MPKKGKKGGKGKKGKKGGKKSSKKDKDVELTMAVANAKLWQSRFDVSEKSRNEYRETCKRMASDNDKLHETLYQTEKDTIEVVSYLKQGDIEKDDRVTALQKELLVLKEQAKAEQSTLVAEFNGHLADLEGRLDIKTKEVQAMQAELKLVKEFRRRRAQMETELDAIRENLETAHTDHGETLRALENKFLAEKQRLEKEASDKIAELAERAHTDAIANLDEPTRSIYKENIRLNESLRYHTKESKFLKSRTDTLTLEAEKLREKKVSSDVAVKGNVTESKQQKHEIKELKEKIGNLEEALDGMVKDFKIERRVMEQNTRTKVAASDGEINRLKRIYEMKKQEINNVKVVAKRVIEQRSPVEIFFLDALEKVRNEVAMGRAEYAEAARDAYQRKMMAAHSGQTEFPKVDSLKKGPHSITDGTVGDVPYDHSLDWVTLGEKVDVRDLTWEQKEKVLRLLFTRMNFAKEEKNKLSLEKSESILSIDDKPHISDPVASLSQAIDEVTATFITQPQSSVTLPAIDAKPPST